MTREIVEAGCALAAVGLLALMVFMANTGGRRRSGKGDVE